MSSPKTVESALEFLQTNTGPMAGLINNMVIESLKKTLGEETLNKQLEMD